MDAYVVLLSVISYGRELLILIVLILSCLALIKYLKQN